MAPSLEPKAQPTRPRTGRQARAEATRQRIIDETVTCVLERGFTAASAKHIAERAGVSWGVIQYHFGDRDGILAAVIETGLQELVAAMHSAQIPAEPARARIEALVEAGSRAYTTPIARAGLEILVATRTERHTALDDQLEPFGREVGRLARLVSPGGDATAGRVLLLALRGMALDRLLFSGPMDSGTEHSAIVEVVLAYIENAHHSSAVGGVPPER